jgi:hypothetical protein
MTAAADSDLFAHQLIWALNSEARPPEEAFNPEVKRYAQLCFVTHSSDCSRTHHMFQENFPLLAVQHMHMGLPSCLYHHAVLVSDCKQCATVCMCVCAVDKQHQ